MLPRRVTLLVTLSVVAPVACGDDDGFDYRGEAGKDVAIELSAWVPIVSGGVDDQPGRFIVDTGAPLTLLDKHSFAGLDVDGAKVVDLAGFGLVFPAYDLATSYDLFGDPPGGGVPDGIIGGDLVRHFALRLDYQQGTAALFDGAAPVAGEALAMEVLGGGPSYLPGSCTPGPFCGVLDLPPTRLVVPARFEGGQAVYVMIDTGASATAVSEAFLASLGDATNRPRLDGVTITTASGKVEAALSRVWQLELGEGTHVVAAKDLPILVLPSSELLQNLSDEVDRPLVALVGGSFLREFEVTIDAPAGELQLDRYASRAHIPPDEYVGPGFTMVAGPDGTWLVGDVYANTDAAAEGLARGDVVEELGGQTITGLPQASVSAILDGFAVGQEVAVGVLHDGAFSTRLVTVEDLLPGYPGQTP